MFKLKSCMMSYMCCFRLTSLRKSAKGSPNPEVCPCFMCCHCVGKQLQSKQQRVFLSQLDADGVVAECRSRILMTSRDEKAASELGLHATDLQTEFLDDSSAEKLLRSSIAYTGRCSKPHQANLMKPSSQKEREGVRQLGKPSRRRCQHSCKQACVSK